MLVSVSTEEEASGVGRKDEDEAVGLQVGRLERKVGEDGSMAAAADGVKTGAGGGEEEGPVAG